MTAFADVLAAFTPPERTLSLVTNGALRAEHARMAADLKARTPTQRDADKRLFSSQLTDARLREDFERHGWMSPLNAARIAAFWEEISPDLMAGSGAG